MAELVYFLLIVALACLVWFVVTRFFKFLFWVRAWSREVCADDDNSWLLRVLVSPIYIFFALICLILNAILWIFLLFALKDLFDKWFKE